MDAYINLKEFEVVTLSVTPCLSLCDVKTKKNIDCIVVKNPHCKGNFDNEEMILIQLKIN